MKKIEYQSPEMEVYELKYQKPLLDASIHTGDSEGGSGTGFGDDVQPG